MLAAAVVYWNSATTTTIVLVRHAEKQLGAISDAPLSPQGELRATRLAQMFGDSEPFGRVQQDLCHQHAPHPADRRGSRRSASASSADRRGREDSTRASSRSRVLRENRGGLALIVGHSNTVPEIVAALSRREDVPPIGEEEFDTLYVVTVPTIGKASVLRMKY